MKRKLNHYKSLKQAVLAVPAAALMLGASQGAQIGLNIQTWWPQYGAPTPGVGFGYQTTGWPVTAAAFGLGVSEWTSTLPLDGYSAVNTNVVFGGLTAKLEARNPWASGIGWSGGWTPATVTPGDDEVTWGYLDDSVSGPQVTLSGFRAIASSFTIQTIAAIGGSQDSFPDVTLTTNGVTSEILDYTNGTYVAVSGTVGTSTVSTVYSTLTGNNSIKLKAGDRDGRRSTIAGIIVKYTPGNNPPLIETQPQAPATALFPGGSFSLSASASGTPTLSFQWRKGGVNIPGATDSTYAKTGITTGDSGNYDVVVTNPYGSPATSAVVVIDVQNVVAPVITQAPLSQNPYQGYPVSLTAAATGGSLSYQWKLNTVAIPGATTSAYNIPSVASSNAGTYTIEVSNPVGPTASASAVLTVKVPQPGSYEAAIAQTKPLVWFRYSETQVPVVDTGSAANSGSAGSADNGVAKFYTSFQQPGAIVGDANKSASFNGGQAIDVPFDPALNTATFTVELWAKPVDATGARAPVYNRGPSSGDGWLFWAFNGNTKWQFRTYTGATRNTVTSTADAIPGVWTHLVGVYDGTTTHLYVNGVEEGTGFAGTFTPNSSIPLRIGGAGNDTGAAGVNAWNGGVDEVAIYSTVLTPAEILSHFENGTNSARSTSYDTLVQASAPVGYWRLNDPAGLIAPTPKNSGTLGAAFDGMYGGDIMPGGAGPVPPTYPGLESTNRAVSMVSGWTTCPQLPLNTNTVTVTTWIKRSEPHSTGDLSWPAWLGGGGMHLNLTTSPTPGELRYHWNGNNWGWSSGLFVPVDVWTFCAMVVEPTKATFYMSDGTTLKTSVDNSAHNPMVVTSQPGFGGNQPANGGRNYIGQLDESTVYDRALSQSEINSLFMAGTGAKLQLTLSNGGIIQDTKPVGVPHHGVNTAVSATWVASNTDAALPAVTRTGVEQFSTAVPSQITVAPHPDFDSPVGTIMFWMRANSPVPGPGTEAAMLVDRRTSSGTVITLNDAGAIFVQCAGGANSFTAGYVVDDAWHHIAVTYDQSASGFVSIYIDGGPAYGPNPNASAWSWPATQQIELGRSHDGYWKRLDGYLDDFRIYSRILTEAEIASVKASNALVDTAALKLRFNFDTVGIGKTVSWPFGTLESTPVLGPGATWLPVSGATAPNYPFLPTDPQLYFRAIP